MPIYDYVFPSNAQLDSRLHLQHIGPVIEVEITVPDSLVQLFQTLSMPIPQPVNGLGILDTGAFTTSVNKSILQGFGVQPVGTAPVSTPGTSLINMDVYPAKIEFPGTTIVRNFDKALAMEDMSGSFNGKNIIALIGREVLADCVLIYNGKTGIYTLSH